MLDTFDLTVFILSRWSQHSTLLLVFFFVMIIRVIFFNKQPSW